MDQLKIWDDSGLECSMTEFDPFLGGLCGESGATSSLPEKQGI